MRGNRRIRKRGAETPANPEKAKSVNGGPQGPQGTPWRRLAGYLRHLRHPRIALVAIAAALLIGLGVFCFVPAAGPQPQPAPTPEPTLPPTPEPTLTPTPTITPTSTPWPTPQPFDSVIPGHIETYAEYRFAHFLFEYAACYQLPNEWGQYLPTKETEDEVLGDLRKAVRVLLRDYDRGDCTELAEWGLLDGRGTWLRYWSR